MRKILTGSINPPAIRFAMKPDDGGGEGGGASPNGEGGVVADGKVGSAFQKMISTMQGEDPKTAITADPPADDKKSADDSKKAGDPPAADDAAKQKAEKDAAAAAEAAAAAKEKAKPKTKRDPMLDVLEKKAEPEVKKDDVPIEDPKVKEAQEAEIAAATKGMSSNAAANFRKASELRYAAEAEAAKLKAEVEKLRNVKPELPAEVKAQLAELERLRQEHAATTDILEKIGAERSPAYQQKFVKGKQQLIEKAKGLLVKYGGDAKLFEDAMALHGKDRSAAIARAMEDMETFDQQRVAGVMTEMETLEEEGGKFLGNAREALQAEERLAQQQELERGQQMIQAKTNAFIAKANSILHKLPDDHPDAPEVNGIVEKVIQESQEFLFKGDKFDDFAEAAIARSMFPIMKQKLQDAALTIAKLESQIEELTSADPNLGSGGGGAGNQDGGAGKEQSFIERFKNAGQSAAA